MREFFRGWKRKVGVVALVLACVFAIGWVRSLYIADFVTLSEFFGYSQTDNRLSGVGTGLQSVYFYVNVIPTPLPGNSGEFLTPSAVIPFWSIVLPLTALSTFLILFKPQYR